MEDTYFYPRSPCGERLRHAQRIAPIHANFYPRSPCGERQQKCTKQWGTFAHMKQILWGLHLHADRQGCILPFLPLFFPYFLVRMNREFYDCLSLALSKQDSILIKIRVQTHMLDFAFVMVSQLIKAQAVRFRIDQFGQFCFEHRVLRGIQQALKYGVLHPLAVVYTDFCSLRRPAAVSVLTS